MDSNSQIIQWDRFWVTEGINAFLPCSSLINLPEILQASPEIDAVKCVVVATGINDIDTQSAEEVLLQIQQNVNLLRERFHETKIVISEIPPRTDDRDEEVKKCNVLINGYVDDHDFLLVVNHAKLRTADGRNYRDAKHITNYASPLFVANIKRPMRMALGRAKHRFPYPNEEDAAGDGNRGRGRGRGRGRAYDQGRGGGRGGGRGRGYRGGRGSWGNNNRGRDNGGRFDIREEFDKLKTELMTIINNR